MTRIFQRHRQGTTLIELLIFIAILAITAVSMIPLLFTATEDRLLQQTISVVEQNGAQLMQTIAYHVRHAEKIVSPAAGSSGAVLVIQTASGSTNPIIFGVSTGSLVIVQRTVKQVLSSAQVAVGDFHVVNTSSSATRQNVLISFTISRTIRLQSPRSYSRTFETLLTLFPDDEWHQEACGTCAVPGCAGGNYVWQVCEAALCLTAQTQLECP